MFTKTLLNEQSSYSGKLALDINSYNREISDEYIHDVFFKAQYNDDPDFNKAVRFSEDNSILLSDATFWESNKLRLFISHRDGHRKVADQLADALEPYGVSSFVAHDSIEPMIEWQKEIEKALETMEVFVALITQDFHESNWTNQEMGFALGKRVPVICLKLGNHNPEGFVSSFQGMQANYHNIQSCAPDLYQLIMQRINKPNRAGDLLVEQFASATSYMDAMERLHSLKKLLPKLTENQLQRIVKGYSENNQLNGCGGIHTSTHSLKNYLNKATGKHIVINGDQIIVKDK